MRIKIFFTVVCSCLWMLGNRVSATHIVGGDLTYKHLKNDSFQITLKLYVDCINGSQAAINGDTDAVVGIFDSTGMLLRTMIEVRTGPTRINSVSLDCVIPPGNACVDEYIYTFYTVLPQRQGGYFLAFQRCCRNGTIKNIIQPLSSGATYWCYMPDTTWSQGYNTAAVFKALPPNYLCGGRPFEYDHSAFDADGDSLAYELYAPFLGGGSGNSQPRPPDGPPYQTIAWQGAYEVERMMLGHPELTIDPLTGKIDVTPQTTGQFVVGIAVKEYRNGKHINTTRRDFQFNVFTCVVSIVSSFVEDVRACSDTIRFTNNSIGATRFFWDFGDTTTTYDTSSVFEPTYIYGRTGIFKIRLKVNDGNCRDSVESSVFIDGDVGTFGIRDTTICPGESVYIGSKDSIGFSYLWRSALYLDDPHIPNPISRPDKNIRYIGQRVSELCVNTDTVNISIKKTNTDFLVGLVDGCKDVSFKVTPAVKHAIQLWRIDDRNYTTQQLEVQKFLYNQQVKLKSIVFDGQCWDTLEQLINPVFVDSFTTIPNVFTPNNDGLNDCYSIDHVELIPDCSRLKVYSRWGILVYDSDENGSCWDGASNGASVAEGVYYYILNHRGKDYHGTITLMR